MSGNAAERGGPGLLGPDELLLLAQYGPVALKDAAHGVVGVVGAAAVFAVRLRDHCQQVRVQREPQALAPTVWTNPEVFD